MKRHQHYITITRGLSIVIVTMLLAMGASALLEVALIGALPASSEPHPASTTLTPEPTPLSSPDEATVVYNRNIFSRSVDAPPSPPQPPVVEGVEVEPSDVTVTAEGAAEALPLRLIGTMVAEDPRYSVAHVGDNMNGETFHARVGDTLYDAEIVHIGRTQLWVRRQYGEAPPEALHLGARGGQVAYTPPPPRVKPTRDPSTIIETHGNLTIRRRDPRASSDDPTPKIAAGALTQVAPDHYEIAPATVAVHAGKIRALTDSMRLRVVQQSDNSLGVRVGRAGPDTLLNGMGLRPNDVITRVNGEPVEDERAALQFLEQLSERGHVSLEFDRRGRRQTLTLTSEQEETP